MKKSWLLKFSLVILTLGCCLSCTERTVEKIHAGSDYCDHCKMQITDRRFGGAILTKQGKTLKYDSVECLAHGNRGHSHDLNEIYVVDYQTQELTPLSKMNLYRNDKVRGPMGSRIQGSAKPQPLPLIKLQDVQI